MITKEKMEENRNRTREQMLYIGYEGGERDLCR